MKKIILSVFAISMMLASCTTVTKTATTLDVNSGLNSVSTTDLEISSQKISYTHKTTSKERKGGHKNIRNSAIQAAIAANGGGDVLVAPQFTEVKKSGLFGSKIKTVTVEGYVGKYKNFQCK